MNRATSEPSCHSLPIHQSRRLVSLSVVKAVIGENEDFAMALVENGTIPWAFNISSGEKLREVRVLACSLLAEPVTFPDLEAVIAHIIPPTRTNLRASELCQWWDCGHDLLDRAVKRGRLAGRVSSHLLKIEAASARRFLAERTLGATPPRMPQDVFGGVKTPPGIQTGLKPAAIDGRKALRFQSDPGFQRGGAR